MIKSLIKRGASKKNNSYLKKIIGDKQKRDIAFDDIHKVLCIQMNAIGDTIMTQPAWSALKELRPNLIIDLMCQPHIAYLFQNDPSISSVLAYQNSKNRLWPFFDFGFIKQNIYNKKYDLIIDFTALPTTAAICAGTSAPPSIGFRRFISTPWYQTEITSAYDLSFDYSDRKNLREVMLHLLFPWGINGNTKTSPKISISNNKLEKAQKLLKKNKVIEKSYIVFHPGAKWMPKRWPTAYWLELVKKVISHSSYPVILLGSNDDANRIESISNKIDSGTLIPFISNDLVLSSSIIKMAKLCVCNDSAAMHIAASVNTPAIAIFGPVSPKRSAPKEEEGCSVLYDDIFCSPCTLYYSESKCRRGLNFCMFAIDPSLVHNLIENKLQKLGL